MIYPVTPEILSVIAHVAATGHRWYYIERWIGDQCYHMLRAEDGATCPISALAGKAGCCALSEAMQWFGPSGLNVLMAAEDYADWSEVRAALIRALHPTDPE